MKVHYFPLNCRAAGRPRPRRCSSAGADWERRSVRRARSSLHVASAPGEEPRAAGLVVPLVAWVPRFARRPPRVRGNVFENRPPERPGQPPRGEGGSAGARPRRRRLSTSPLPAPRPGFRFSFAPGAPDRRAAASVAPGPNKCDLYDFSTPLGRSARRGSLQTGRSSLF